MTLALAIVADDLTGALDTSTPFVAAGFKVAVAVTPEALDATLKSGADIIAVNTASRAMSAEEAAAAVAEVAVVLRKASPAIVLKKVDSRLKGNVGVESAALAHGMRRVSMLVAPAVPDQQRFTRKGAVVGTGVEAPIDIAPLFTGVAHDLRIADAQTDADLDTIVARQDWSTTLAVGARGLGGALARSLAAKEADADLPFVPHFRTLFAFGSRDPITDAQVLELRNSNPLAAVLDAPGGRLPLRSSLQLPLVMRCTGDQDAAPDVVAHRFAVHVAEAVAGMRPETLVMGGGDTALAILRALGAAVLFPRGEAAPGLPWFEVTLADGKKLRCVVKSGGFGSAAVLCELLGIRVEERAEY